MAVKIIQEMVDEKEKAGAFLRNVRQAALAIAYDFSEITDDDFENPTTWAGQSSIARLRMLFPDATILEAHEASIALRAWAESQERSAQVIALVPR